MLEYTKLGIYVTITPQASPVFARKFLVTCKALVHHNLYPCLKLVKRGVFLQVSVLAIEAQSLALILHTKQFFK